MKKPKIAILTNVIPVYRQDFFDTILKSQDYEITIFCQNRIPKTNLTLIHNRYSKNVRIIPFVAIGKEALVFQFFSIRTLLKYDIIISDGNLRNVFQCFLMIFFKIAGKKIVIWSMVQSFNSNSFFLKLRLFYWRFFNYFIMYTEKDKKMLSTNGFSDKSIISINNGLNQLRINENIDKWTSDLLKEWKTNNGLNDKIILISSGRVNQRNDYLFVLNGVKKMIPHFPNLLWVLIGNGDQFEEINREIKMAKLEKNVRILGEIYEEEILAPWFLSSELFLHPKAVGLSLMHAYGYGLPVVAHSNVKNHGPEFSLFENNFTGSSFVEGDLDSFVNAILELLRNSEKRYSMKEYVKKIVDQEYNTQVMASRFLQMVNKIK